MNVVVTGGGTIAPIDDVRFIANRSTGLFAARITEACLARGAHVWLIHTPSALLPFRREAWLDLDAPDLNPQWDRLGRLRERWRDVRDRLRLIPLPSGTVREYAERLEQVLRGEAVDIAFLAMAVSDFQPEPVPGKLSSGLRKLTIYCRPTPKVIRSVRDWAPQVYLVGFKLLSGASTEELLEAAQTSCRQNHADLVVANDLTTVAAGRHAIHLVRPGQAAELHEPPEDVADVLVDRVFGWARERAQTPPIR